MQSLTYLSDFDSIFKMGENVFGSKEKFNSWFNTNNVKFENKKPSDVVINYDGLDLIVNELNKIKNLI